jgi:hypothetical protein
MVDDIDGEINRWLKGIVLRLGLDCSIVAEIDASGWGAFTHGWARDRDEIIRQPLDVNSLLPWLLKKVMAGETISSGAVRPIPG